MKNKHYINSFNKVEPDEAAQERMLHQIFNKANSDNSQIRKVNFRNKKTKWLTSLAACFVLVIAVTVVVGGVTNWFSGKILTENLGNNTLNFYKANIPGQDVSYGDTTTRNLTAEENEILFGGLENVTAYGFFSSAEKTLVHVEARISEKTKILFSAEGYSVTDVVIEGNKKSSDILGTKVVAGYFITNSKGIRNIIYFADFKLNSISYYVELGGEKSESDSLRAEISSVIAVLIQNGVPNLTLIVA